MGMTFASKKARDVASGLLWRSDDPGGHKQGSCWGWLDESRCSSLCRMAGFAQAVKVHFWNLQEKLKSIASVIAGKRAGFRLQDSAEHEHLLAVASCPRVTPLKCGNRQQFLRACGGCLNSVCTEVGSFAGFQHVAGQKKGQVETGCPAKTAFIFGLVSLQCRSRI